MGIEGQQQRGPLLDETDASVSLAVQAALVPCGRSQPACQVEGVLRPGGRGIPDTETGLTARPPRAHGLPGRGTAPVPRWRERLQRGLPLGTRATGRSAGGVDRPHLRPLGLPLLLGGLPTAPPSGAGAGETGEARLRRPPLCAARGRWSAARTAPRAPAIRRPGGCHGPPCASLSMPRVAGPYSRTTARASASGGVSGGRGASLCAWPELRARVGGPVGRAVRCAASTARAMARHPRMGRRLFPVAWRSAAHTGWAPSRRP